jgi:transcriptional regulator with XRE-family HTH domain
MDIGDFIRERIRQARTVKPLSQREFARLVGTSQATISDIERGRVQINTADLAQFASLLDRPISFFFPPNGQFVTESELNLLDLLRQLPPRWQDWLTREAEIHVEAYKKVKPYV